MIKITHIRAAKVDADKFKRWAKKRGLTSSQAFKILTKRIK